jgi:hypothetical protein
MTVTRNTGADLLPFAPRPSYPGARLRALQNACSRREREAPPPDEAFDAERLRRDLASVPPDVALKGEEREHLRRMGWTDERLRRAEGGLRDDLDSRVHPRDPAVTAAGGVPGRGRVSGTSAPARSPAVVAQLTAADRRGILDNVAAARAAGTTRTGGSRAGVNGCSPAVARTYVFQPDQGGQGPEEGLDG